MTNQVRTAHGARSGPVVPTESAATTLRPGIGGRITGGLWAERRRVNADTSIPDGWDRLIDAGNIHNLRLAAGTATGRYRSDLPFMDSDVYKWLEAVGWLLGGAEVDEKAREQLSRLIDQAIEVLSAAQEEDGYLNSYVQVTRPNERWRHLDWGHELYSAGHLLQAAVAVARGAGRTDVLDVARRLADRIDNDFGTEPGRLDAIDGHPEIEMALVELYRLTGERQYLDRAAYFLDRRGNGLLGTARHGGRTFGSGYWQDHVPVREATEVVGHSVRQLYLLAGAVDVYAEIGDAALLAAAERLWEEMVATKTYLTGGVGAHHVDEAFGEQYELPNERAYAETCAAIASVMLSWRLLLATGKARYADLIERTLYNGLLAGVSLTGTEYFYVNPLQRRYDPAVSERGDQGAQRTRWFRCACCPPNVMRTLASLEHYVLAADDSSVAITQYLPGEFEAHIATGVVRLAMRTDLPWDGTVDIIVDRTIDQPFTLALRMPAWSARTTVTLNGSAVEDQPQDGWLRLIRAWQPDDHVVLTFDMEVRLVAGDPRVDAIRGTVALERGPLVYCLESVDQPAGGRLDDVLLDPETPIDVRPRPDLLDGITTLTLTGWRRPKASTGWWPYHHPGPEQPLGEAVQLTAVPYFTWANRDIGAMRVWIPTH